MVETKTAAAPKAAKTPQTVDYRSREHRKPMTGLRQRLAAEIPNGLVGRWVIDEPGRVNQFIQAGWKFATREDGVTREQDDRDGAIFEEHALTGRRGESVRQYLMLIPRELYNEDQRAKLAELDRKEESMQAGASSQMQAGDGVYIPEGVINRTRDSLASTNSEE